MYLSLIVTFILILGTTIFALQNGMPLEVNFFIWGFNTSLITVIFGSSLIGAVIMAVIAVPGAIRKHFRVKKQARMIYELGKKSQELENQLIEKGEEKEEEKETSFDSPSEIS